MLRRRCFFAMLLIGAMAPAMAQSQAGPPWVEPMRKVHQAFSGTPGQVLQLGDSITYSMAFWSVLGWKDPSPWLGDDGLPKQPGGRPWKQVLSGFRDKGKEHGNFSGWTVDRLVATVDQQLAAKRPEVALIMIGTNDVKGGSLPGSYRGDLETVITRCLEVGCVPIVSTIPPMRDRAAGVDQANRVIAELAAQYHLPLVDYHAAILERRPDDWDGSLISKDGIHPSGGGDDFSPETLRQHGYQLRTWVTFLTLREVYFRVLHPDLMEGSR